MDSTFDHYQSALDDVEALVLDCFAGYRDGSKNIAEIAADIRGVGAEIRVEGDPHRMAALDEVMHRPIRAWRVVLNGPVGGGAA